MKSDVVIVGGGFGGAIAAALLSRAGCGVIVVDRHATYPADFRAEQLVGSQTDALRRLGLLDGIVRQVTPMPDATASSRGRVIDTTRCPHYGLHYETMVEAARLQARAARFVTARVAQVATSPDLQTVILADGTAIEARLVILATGLNCGGLLPRLGIGRSMLSEDHSLTLGFDVQTPARRILVCYGERLGDGMDYLTVFPIAGTMRANLFCYRKPRDPWVKAFKREPRQALLAVMPSLERTLGAFEVAGKVQVRPSSIQRAENVRQAGIVLIGDAFQTSCPAVGTGIGRILSDVEVLRRLVPAWLATQGMDAGKIAEFYQDRAKCQFDARAIADARQRRAMCTQTSWRWKAYRMQHYGRRRVQDALSRIIQRDLRQAGGAAEMR